MTPQPRLTAEWVSIRHYAHRFDVSRTTVYKWAALGIVTVERTLLPGHRRPLVRVKNLPPRGQSL